MLHDSWKDEGYDDTDATSVFQYRREILDDGSANKWDRCSDHSEWDTIPRAVNEPESKPQNPKVES